MCVKMKLMSSRTREHLNETPATSSYNAVLDVRLDWDDEHCFTTFCLNWRPVGFSECASFHVNMKPKDSERLPPGGIPKELADLIGDVGLTDLLKQAFVHVRPSMRDLFEIVPESLHVTHNGSVAVNIKLR